MNKSKSKTAIRYTAEFRRQMVELVRAGRKPRQLSQEFGCTAWSIQRWFNQAEREAGQGDGEARLRRENRQLKVEREILSKAAAWFAQETVPNSKHSSDL